MVSHTSVLGVNVSAVNLRSAAAEVEAWIAQREKHYVCVTGVHGVMESHDDAALREIHNRAGLVVPDGMPLVWVSHRRGAPHVGRVYGPDLMLELCKRSVVTGAKHFLYGGADGVADLLAERLKERFPGIQIAGTYCPPFRPLSDKEVTDVARRINGSKADLVWVGLSTPKQERWMDRFRPILSAPALLGVGAAFDFHAGLKPQAPAWMQDRGLEWLFRAWSEPRRLGPRYLKNNPRFLWHIAREEWGLRQTRKAHSRITSAAHNPSDWTRPTPPDSRRPQILAIAYSAEPGRGSEPGAGWGMLMALSRIGDVTALVKSEHMEAIRSWERQRGSHRITFVEVAPRVVPSLQKLHRITQFLTYLDWLGQAKRTARELVAAGAYDVVQHLTYSVYWLPSPVTDLGLPSIWGPVAGGVTAPRGLWRRLGLKGLFDEVLDRVAVGLCALLPATRRTWSRATVRIVQNEGTRDRLPEHLKADTRVQNAAVFNVVDAPPVSGRDPVVLFPSSLVSRKCPQLALEALTYAPDVRLQFVHSGPQEEMLKHLTKRLGLSDRVEFLGRVSRGELFERMARASAAVFTGVREEGGLALAEAMGLGTPVVVLDVGGAGTIARTALDPEKVQLVDPQDEATLPERLGLAMSRFVQRPHPSHAPNLSLDLLDEVLREVLDEALGWSVARPPKPVRKPRRSHPILTPRKPVASPQALTAPAGGGRP